MALGQVDEAQKILNSIYADKSTTNVGENFVDRSDVLLKQMNFIAMYNKSALHIK